MASLSRHAAEVALAAALGLLAGAGCEKSPFEADRVIPSDPTPATPSARRPEIDAGFALERPDPLPPAGDLRDDVERFTTLDACVAQHAVIDPLIGDAVRSIGYDTLLRDACRIPQAIKLKDPTPCMAITASSLQNRCEALVAMALQDPEKCPWYSPTEKQLGRDPSCLAIATRDPRTCGASLDSTQATCEALASGDQTRCGKGVGDERAQCAHEMERDRTLLAGEHEAHDTTPPRAHLDIHGVGGTKDPPSTDVDLSSTVVGGAVVAAVTLGGAGIVLARDVESALRLPSRVERPHLTAMVEFEAGAPKLTKLDLTVPKIPEMTCPSSHCSLVVVVPKADPKRGAPLSATIDGTIETPAGTYQVKLQIDTFVRDVVGRGAMYGGR
ncbi:MAG: hypothetical protein ACLQVI_03190 [Polyangiaceae bacterium]|jgi:hypothetical protein